MVAKGKRKAQPVVEEEESGSDAPSESDEEEEIGDYERKRLQRIAENQRKMEQLGLLSVKEKIAEAQAAAHKSRKRPPKKEKLSEEERELLPLRRSGRLAGAKAEPAAALPDDKYAAAAAARGETAPRRPQPLGPEPLPMVAGNVPQETSDYMRATMAAAAAAAALADEKPVALTAATKARVEILNGLKLQDSDVAKVCKERAYTLCWHPSSDKLILSCGDKFGSVGVWAVDARRDDKFGGEEVLTYTPHSAAVCRLQYLAGDAGRMFSTSYDGTVRVMDLARGEFVRIYGEPANDSSHPTYSDLGAPGHGACGNLLLMSNSDGEVKAIDWRAGGNFSSSNTSSDKTRNSSSASGSGSAAPGKNSGGAGSLSSAGVAWQLSTHAKKCNTVHILPTSGNMFVTASLDRTIKLWDARMMGGGGGKGKESTSPMPVATMTHELSVNGAHFNPSGGWLGAVSMDNKLHFYKDPTLLSGQEGLAPHHSVPHNNRTGRWLTKFQISWDTKSDDLFVVGCMEAPRRIQIFPAEGRKPVVELKGDAMNSVQSVNAFHPHLDVIAGVNSSSRVHVFR